MFARVARPLSSTTMRFTSTTSKRVTLSSRSTDKKPKVNGGRGSHNKVMKGTRPVSTSPSPSNADAPGNPDPVLGGSHSFLDVKIPPPEVDLESPIQVPYVPDFWNSAKPAPDPPFTEVPKVVVVGGTETSHGSARPHTLEDINVALESDSTQQTERSDSFLDDIAEDLHLPPVQEIKNSFRKIFS